MANITYIPAPNVTLLSAKWESNYITTKGTSAYWDSTYTSLKGNSALWDSTYTTVNGNSAYWDIAYIDVSNNSANWTSAFTTVLNNSANWNAAIQNSNNLTADVNALKSASGVWNDAYAFSTTASGTLLTLQGVSGGSNVYSILTSFTANPVFDTLSVTNSAEIHILSVDRLGVGVRDPQYPVHIVGDTVIFGDLTAGNVHFLNTITSTTTALSVVNFGTQTAGVIRQTGDLPVVEFYDGDALSFFVDGNQNRPGYVGIKTNTPNKELTVVGDISATGSIYAANIVGGTPGGTGGGSSVDVQAFSGRWNSAYNTLTSTSGNWDIAYNYVTNNSAALTDLRSASASWQSNYTTTNANSANWSSVYLSMRSASATYDTYVPAITIVRSNSASWNSVYLSMRSASAVYDTYTPVATAVTSLSSSWTRGYTYATGVSASVFTMQTLTAGWNAATTYTQNISNCIADVQTSSAKWNQAYSDTLGGKAKWDIAYSLARTTSASITDIQATSAFWTVASINFNVDGGGGLISLGRKGYVVVPSNFIIDQWEVLTDVNSTTVFDVLSSSYASFPTKVSIVGGDYPRTSNAQKNINSSLTTWSNLSTDTILEVNVTSNNTASLATLSLKGRRVNI